VTTAKSRTVAEHFDCSFSSVIPATDEEVTEMDDTAATFGRRELSSVVKHLNYLSSYSII